LHGRKEGRKEGLYEGRKEGMLRKGVWVWVCGFEERKEGRNHMIIEGRKEPCEGRKEGPKKE
jgi:hypothetical protein